MLSNFKLNILLINCSSKIIEFALSENSKISINKKLDSVINADSLIYKLLKEFDNSNKSVKNVDVVSLSNGPGSFTGLRIGSAIAKGICFANKCKLVEINTLDIVANQYKDDADVIAMIFSKSRTEEFYFAEYKVDNGKLQRTSGYGVRKIDDININDKIILINENNTLPFLKDLDVIDVSGLSNIQSQIELTMDYIKRNVFSDYRTSEPFYMKDFIPLTKM